MKFFKNARTWIATALCGMLCLSGSIAIGSLYGLNNANATEGSETVQVSEDIQKIIDGFNNAKGSDGGNLSKYVSAEYVTDQTLLDGTSKVSGIKLTFTSDFGDRLIFPDFNVNVSNLTAKDSLMGFVALPSSYDDKPFNLFSVYCLKTDTVNGFSYFINNDQSTTVSLKSNVNVRILYGNKESEIHSAAIYRNSSTQLEYAYGITDSAVKSASLNGYRTEPFNVYYDYSQNAVYSTKGNAHDFFDKKHFDMLLGQDPTTWADVGFVDKYDEITQLYNFDNKNNKDLKYFNGFENGDARLGMRLIVNSGKTGSIILTSYAGLDLTNPTNVYSSEKAALAVDYNRKSVAVNNEVDLTASYVNPVTGKAFSDKTFNGTVTVYQGEKKQPGAYSAYGAQYSSITAELNCESGTVVENGKYTFSQKGAYTVEYKEDDLSVYQVITVTDPVMLSLNTVKTTVYKNGVALNNGDTVFVGDVITVKPDNSATIFGYNEIKNKILINEDDNFFQMTSGENVVPSDVLAYMRDLSSFTYTIKESDVVDGNIKITALAYDKVYTMNYNRYNKSGTVETYFYDGIDGRYYKLNGWGGLQQNASIGSWYNIISYDGAKLTLHGNSMAWDLPTNTYSGNVNQLKMAYKITFADGTKGIYKIGGNVDSNKVAINQNITLDMLFLDTATDYDAAFVKTAGTVGLSVKFRINKNSYDSIYDALADEDKSSIDVTAVVVPAKYYNSVSDVADITDSYRWQQQATSNKDKIATVKVKNWLIDDNGNKVIEKVKGCDYYVFYVTIKNIKEEDYANGFYFGATLTCKTNNGGDVWRWNAQNGSDKRFVEVNVLSGAAATYTKNVKTASEEGFTTSVIVDGETYYVADGFDQKQAETVIKFYYKGLYQAYVSDTEISGYTQSGSVWYDAGKITDAELLAKVLKYNGVTVNE